MIQISVEGHLIIPFGSPKWDIEKIRIIGISTDATYLSSETPCVYIDKTKKQGVRLRHFTEIFPGDFSGIKNDDPEISLKNIKEHLKNKCEVQTESERRFLDIYFDYCLSKVKPTQWHYNRFGKDKMPKPFDYLDWVFDALMPLPQAHLYLLWVTA
jgi:hypothetical protein